MSAGQPASAQPQPQPRYRPAPSPDTAPGLYNINSPDLGQLRPLPLAAWLAAMMDAPQSFCAQGLLLLRWFVRACALAHPDLGLLAVSASPLAYLREAVMMN
jgi:hypothetical protein